MFRTSRERRERRRKLAVLTVLLAVAVAVFVVLVVIYVDFREFADKLKNINYTFPTEIAEIRDKLNLTDRGQTILAASRPVLEGSEQFNQDCESHNDKVSILGCYTRETIYLYDIEADGELAGIVESTAAHELLHAVWARLTGAEREQLAQALNETYGNNAELLSSGLDTYAAEDRLDELHSRVGTQVANLPGVLETHYAKYFNDQDAVVALYEHYSAPFNALRAEQSDLTEQLNELKAQIDAKTEDYTDRQDALSNAIDEFNSCAATAGCFATDAAFNARRGELVGEQAELSGLYAEIDELIAQYNALVTDYNDSVFQIEKLENTINSNTPEGLME